MPNPSLDLFGVEKTPPTQPTWRPVEPVNTVATVRHRFRSPTVSCCFGLGVFTQTERLNIWVKKTRTRLETKTTPFSRHGWSVCFELLDEECLFVPWVWSKDIQRSEQGAIDLNTSQCRISSSRALNTWEFRSSSSSVAAQSPARPCSRAPLL